VEQSPDLTRLASAAWQGFLRAYQVQRPKPLAFATPAGYFSTLYGLGAHEVWVRWGLTDDGCREQTHSKETRGVFQIKNLHLGHLATSFALKDKPSKVADR
jgi:hypothetical protein